MQALAASGHAVSEALGALTDVAASIRTLLGAAAGRAQSEAAAADLAQQQRSVGSAARIGMLILLAATALVALRYGAIWEVHAACSAGSSGGGWARWALPAQGRTALSGVAYFLCTIQHMGASPRGPG